METTILMQLLDEVASLKEIAKSLKKPNNKTLIDLQVAELQRVLEKILSTEIS
ncbi:hypothetical protein HZQ13_15250 [Elizabethkingia anophelis]|nr:hypothetical protein [Elizabethkingia anophelis]